MTQRPIPMASATTIFAFGNHRDPGFRLRFVNKIVTFADLDGYEHRAAFIAAYSTGGSEAARRHQARLLADSCLLRAEDIAYCVDFAESDRSFDLPGYTHTPEIV